MTSVYLPAACVLMLAVVNCSKILIIVSHPARSHHNALFPILVELANRRHDVTVQTFHAFNLPHTNVLELMMQQGDGKKTTKMKGIFLNLLNAGPVAQMRNLAQFKSQTCAQYLNDETTKNLLASGLQFELVIVDAFLAVCQTALASLVGKHIVKLYTDAVFPWETSAIPASPSYVPIPATLMPSKMTFLQRIENTIYTFGVRYIYEYNIKQRFQEAILEILPELGTIEAAEKKVVFSITNSDPILTSPRPSMPNVVNCGGMHCRMAKPLPKEFKDFAASSDKDGFIIFSLGSNMNAADVLSSEFLQRIITAFSRLKQKIIWKFEDKLENLPKNIKVVEWMPQQDLLGHPNARLFITHSGRLSLQEAIYHGVPVIGMPFFGDQRGNTMRIKELGIGEHFDLLNITADGFYEIIIKLLSDKSYSENMKKYSAIFKDQPERPVDTAIYWIEYVLRHDGASHFVSAAEDLNFIQYFLLDIAGCTLLITVAALVLLLYLTKISLAKCYRRKTSTNQQEKRRN